jgi:hypothetical protein
VSYNCVVCVMHWSVGLVFLLFSHSSVSKPIHYANFRYIRKSNFAPFSRNNLDMFYLAFVPRNGFSDVFRLSLAYLSCD